MQVEELNTNTLLTSEAFSPYNLV